MSSPEQWELADEILVRRMDHPRMRWVREAIADLYVAQAEGFDRNEALKRCGVGRTEAPTFLLLVADALDKLARACRQTAEGFRQKMDR
jgi:hypothetical protein